MVLSHPTAIETPSAILPATLDRLRNALESALAAHRDRILEAPTHDDISIAIHRRSQDAYSEVLAALARIHSDTYGTCQSCNRSISEDRLDAMPHARYCMQCAQHTRKET